MSATARSAVANNFEPSSFFLADSLIFVVAKLLYGAYDVAGLGPRRQI